MSPLSHHLQHVGSLHQGPSCAPVNARKESPLASVVAMNSRGIEFLGKHEHGEAFRCFQTCLQRLSNLYNDSFVYYPLPEDKLPHPSMQWWSEAATRTAVDDNDVNVTDDVTIPACHLPPTECAVMHQLQCEAARNAMATEEYARPIYSVPIVVDDDDELNMEGDDDDDCQHRQQADDTFVLFNRPLQISIPICGGSKQPCLAHTLMAGALVYNVALTYHLFALRCPTTQQSACHHHDQQPGHYHPTTRLLRLAQHFYAASYAFFAEQYGSPETNVATLQLGLAATANNLGHIHAHFRSLAEADKCGQEISLRLLGFSPFHPTAATTASSDDATMTTSFSVDEYKILFVNACFFHAKDMNGAPAA